VVHAPGGQAHSTYWIMTGWPKGNWETNNAWAPILFEDGHFALTVTCTSSKSEHDVAWVEEDTHTVRYPHDALMPWRHNAPRSLANR
jgi:hypothetical protein